MVTLISLAILYALLRLLGILSPQLTPGVTDTSYALLRLVVDRGFLLDIGVTVARTVVGVGVGAVVGLPLGLVMGLNSWVNRSAIPVIDFLRALPAVAMFPALATLLGIGESTKLVLIAIPSGLLMAVFGYYACIEVRRALLEYLRLLRISRGEVIRYVYLPSLLARLPAGLRYSLPLGLVLSVVADMFVGADHGLGLRLIAYQETFKLPELYATILVTGILGFLLNLIAEFTLRSAQARGLIVSSDNSDE